MDMASVVEALWGPPSKNSHKWLCQMPQHPKDTDPSFVAYSDHGHCFGCGWHGGPRWFVQSVTGKTKSDAEAWLASRQAGSTWRGATLRRRRVGISAGTLVPAQAWRVALLPFVENSERALAEGNRWAWAELLKRGIIPEVWHRFHVGYNPQPCELSDLDLRAVAGITLPAFVGGDLWSVNIRTESGFPKYNRPEDSDRGYGNAALYGIDNLSGKDHVVIAESEFDALAVVSVAGDVVDAVAIRGTGNWKLLGQYRDLFGGKQVTVCFDNDRGGIEAMGKVRRQWPRWTYCLPPTGMGICDMARAKLDVRALLLKGC